MTNELGIYKKARPLIDFMADAFASVEMHDKHVVRIYINLKQHEALPEANVGILWNANINIKEDIPDGTVILVDSDGQESTYSVKPTVL